MGSEDPLEGLCLLKEGRRSDWISWRTGSNVIRPWLQGADLRGLDLSGWPLDGVNFTEADLKGINLSDAQLRKAIFTDARLTSANLREARLRESRFIRSSLNRTQFPGADLTGATFADARFQRTDFTGATLNRASLIAADLDGVDFTDASLRGANLTDADLFDVRLCGADLERACLERARLMNVDVKGAKIINVRAYGVAAWELRNAREAVQQGLVVTKGREPTITVESLEIAQLIHLLLGGDATRSLLDTVTSKMVLILGRFTAPRMAILEALREELKKRNYVPVIFDFDPPRARTLTETVSTLAHMSRFVIADVTAPRSVAHELATIVPRLQMVPVAPLLAASQRTYAMFEDFFMEGNVLWPFRYKDAADLVSGLDSEVIGPAEAMADELRGKLEAGKAAWRSKPRRSPRPSSSR